LRTVLTGRDMMSFADESNIKYKINYMIKKIIYRYI